MRLGILNVLSLGRIVCERHGYWSDRYLFPVGFLSEREYVSGLDPSLKVCKEKKGLFFFFFSSLF